MPARTGDQYLHGLRDDRQVFLNGERIADVTTHPILGPSARGMAGYFDYQHAHAADCLVPNPHDDAHPGGLMSASHLIPRSPQDLALRHRAFDRCARYSMGMLGRTPDYVNCTYAGFAARTDILSQNGNQQGAENLVAFQRHIAQHDSALTHVLIHPVADKSQPDLQGLNAELALRKVGETAQGIVVRGARILGTLAPFADELAVYTGQPHPKEAAAYSLNFAIPLATPGLTITCRDHYGTPQTPADPGAPPPRNPADHPFSARFDEQDAFIIFDDVVVPHDHVFIDGDVETYNQIMIAGWAANIMQQTSIRARVKLEFAYELCSRMAATLNDRRPETLRMLGEIWSYAELVRAAVRASEADAHAYGLPHGHDPRPAFFPDERPLRSLRPTIPGWMARVNEIIKLIGSHNLLATPTSADFANPDLGPLLETYLPGAAGQHGAPSPAADRAALFRTAWDFAGSALGSRTELYERYYLAGAARIFQINHITAQREQEWTMLPEFLQQIPSPDSPA